MFAWFAVILACSPDVSVTAAGLPDRAPARVLLASIAPNAVAVEAAAPGEAWVDLDAPEDDRYGFRYRIVDGSGDTLYSRTTSGPVIVDAFLAYWSDQSGLDILSALPTLGAFPVQIPILDGGEVVRFDVRDESGEYVERGAFDLARLDALEAHASDAVTGWETIRGGGPPANRLDLAIVGDGFTAEQLPAFREAAEAIAEALLAEEPFASHAGFINIHRVDAVSAVSGASYDCLDGCRPLDTAFDSIYAIEAVNAFTGSTYDTRAIFQADQWEVARAVGVVPWDAVLVVSNTTRFGGMAVHYATTTLYPGYPETAVHELGHSIGLLGDEYTGDYCIRTRSLGTPENIAEDAANLPWAHHVASSTPLPTPDQPKHDDEVGAFAPAYNCDTLYRPQRHCMMNDYGAFCPVCAELLTRRLYRFVDPADDVRLTTDGGTWSLAFDAPSEATVSVLVDGVEVASGTTAGIEFPRPEGAELTVRIGAQSEFVLADPYEDLVQERRWILE